MSRGWGQKGRQDGARGQGGVRAFSWERDSVCADGHDLKTQEAAMPRRTAEAEA